MAEADLVKIDIEGGEWPILTDPRFAQLPTPALVIEYHPAGCPGPDPQAFIRADCSTTPATARSEIDDAPARRRDAVGVAGQAPRRMSSS